MKVLRTLLALISFAAVNYFAGKRQKQTIVAVTKTRMSMFRFFLFDVAITLASLALFWTTTNRISFPAIVAIVLLLVLNYLLNDLIGAISGFTLPDRRQKVGILTFILGAEQRWTGIILILIAAVTDIVCMLAVLITFWRYPIGHPTAAIEVAFFQFFIPEIFGLTVWIAASWPMVTSEYIDNDMRDAHLAGAFSRLFVQSITLAYPIWLLQPEFRSFAARHHFPPEGIWMIVALPMLGFLFGAVVPFVVGIYRRRSEVRRIHEWREAWLSRLSHILVLPTGAARKQAIDEALEDLRNEIQNRFSNNSLFTFYEETIMPNLPAENRLLAAGTQEETSPEDSGFARRAKQARERLRGQIARITLDTEAPPIVQVQRIILKYRSKLVEWDLRFTSIDDLLSLYDIISHTEIDNLKPYIDARLKDATTASKKVEARSVIAATLLTAISSSVAWVAKEYAPELLKFVGRIIPAP
ncbi:MAG TPA: hypothetical protein VII12_08325 [Thermoanaerobaculia bacterium]|jgi:hypothetical protein